MKFIKENTAIITAFLLFLLALFLRTCRLPEFIAYHQDQVRDLYFIKEHFDATSFIWLGPKASVGNFYLAPLWYYLMGVSYLFSHSPTAPALMVAVLNSAATIVLYFFIRRFFDNRTAVISSLLYAVSPFSIEYSRFAWNPNPIPFFVILAVYALFIYIYDQNKGNYIYLAVAASNLAFQSHYQGFLLVAAVFVFPLLKRDWKRFAWSIVFFVVLLAPFLLYEFVNGYPNISQILSFLGRTTHGRSLGVANSLRVFTNDYPEFIARVAFFGYKPLGIVASFMTYFIVAKNIFIKTTKENAREKTLSLIFFILLLTLFVYRQWIVPYYLLVALIPLIIVMTVAMGKFKPLLIVLVMANLALSPAFAKTDSSLRFFEKSLDVVRQSRLSENCIYYEISDPDLMFAPKALEYLAFYQGYRYPKNLFCHETLVFCQKDLCDKINGVEQLRSDFLGVRLIKK
ncbi:MAG: ArnT family glycosyltransferase [Patescibacteria group bacterium]